MIELLSANIAPIMFAGMVCLLMLGYPVAFALGATGILFAIVGIQLGMLEASLLQALPQRIWGVMANETLLAIPFFTFMGLILERSGMAEDLLETVGQLFGPLRGGLAYAVVFVGALLAATTGVIAASVISMGLISLPIMLRYGYDRRLASGVIAASGTLAQIIPPSIVLIVLADQLGRSVGDMYSAAFVPGLLLAGFYISYVIAITIFKPSWAPALPPEARTIRESNGTSGLLSLVVLFSLSVITAVTFVQSYFTADTPKDEVIVVAIVVGGSVSFVVAILNRVLKLGWLSILAEQVTFVMIPPLALIFLVLGSIYLGVATPTEGGAMGAMGALIMAVWRGRLPMMQLKNALNSTARLTAFVLFILIGARIFSLTFYAVDGHVWVESLLTGLPGGKIGFLVVVNLIVFVMAFFLDFFEIAFIVVPLLAPVAEKLGIDPIWFGILLAVNMQTSFMHPPFGFALFFLRSVAPDRDFVDRVTGKATARVTTGQIYWGAVPFVVIQIIMVGLLIAFPGLASPSADDAPKIDPATVQILVPINEEDEDESSLFQAVPDETLKPTEK